MIDLLLRHLVESTLFCLLLGSLTYCLRRQAAAVRYALWLIGILKFAMPTTLLAATGAWVAFLLPTTTWISSLAARLSGLLASLFGFWPVHIPSGKGAFLSFAFPAIWLLGSTVMFGAWLKRFPRRLSDLPIAPNQEQSALAGAQRRLGFAGSIRLRCSEGVEGPVLAGVFRPAILIPPGLSAGLTASEFEAVLLHELAHARRRDNLASALVHCLVCLFWFHPLLWFVERQLITERERACDEMVVNCGTAPEIYLAGLLKVCKFHVLGAVAGVSTASGSNLDARLKQILAHQASQPVPYAVRFFVAGLAVFTTILPFAGGYCEQCGSNQSANKAPAMQISVNQ